MKIKLMADYGCFLDWDDPPNSKKADEAFKQEGKELLQLLQSELGSDYEVTLYDH